MRFFSQFLNHNRVTRYFKNYRNKLINRYFLSKKVDDLDEFIKKVYKKKSVVFSIAYNTPICIEILLNSWRSFAKETTLVIIDNSSNKEASKQIEVICQGKLPYLRLPANPEWHPCRSHALAMNWAYHNLVKSIKPKYFGFLDHDCFPIEHFDLSQKMDGYILYGDKRLGYSLDVWNLWAGFCFFDFKKLPSNKVDFTHRVELGLDTGGSNWIGIYKHLKESVLLIACRDDKVFKNSDGRFSKYEIMDEFIHFGSGSRKDKGNTVTFSNFDYVMGQIHGFID
jgi:hypothetical protein